MPLISPPEGKILEIDTATQNRVTPRELIPETEFFRDGLKKFETETIFRPKVSIMFLWQLGHLREQYYC